MSILPPLPAIGSVRIEIYGPDPAAPKWDGALWDVSQWALIDWRDVTPQSADVKLSWGADDPAGVLSVPAAGSWNIITYDPHRLLDPSNGLSPYGASIRPGRPIRISFMDAGIRRIVRNGLIDNVEFDLSERRGALRGTDTVQLAVSAKLPANQNLDGAMPNTLRARARYLITKAGLDNLITVEPDIAAKQMLANPSFEDDLAGWTLAGVYGASTGIVTPGAIDGAKYLRIQGSGASPRVEQSIDVAAGETYTISGWVYWPTGGTLPPQLQLLARDEAGANIGSNVTVNATLRDQWEFLTISRVAPLNAVKYLVGPRITGTTTTADNGYFDDVRVMGPDPENDPGNDPPVGPVVSSEASVWQHILTAAYDALYACWVDRAGMLRFRSFGDPRDTGIQIGGADGIAIETVKTQGSLQQVFTRVVAFDITAPTVPVERFDAVKAEIYGDIVLKREQPVPSAGVWADNVLADRSGAALQYIPGVLRIQTPEQLESILDLGMIDTASLVVESVTPQVNVRTSVLGATIHADTAAGWSAEVLTYIPTKEWEEGEQPITPPVIPPPDVITGVIRSYACTADARLAHSSSLNAGSGIDNQIPIGWVSPYRNRAVLNFAAIPWAGVVSVDKAELLFRTSTRVCCSFGSTPKIVVKQITGAWSEGSYSAGCGFSTGNAVKYPGPAVTNTGSVTKSVPASEDVIVGVDITAIARAWRAGSVQRGVMIMSAGEDSSKYTTEICSRHHPTTGNRPSVKLTLTTEA